MDPELADIIASFAITTLISFIVFGGVGLYIDRVKNTSRGFWLGFLLGPVGLILAAILPSNPKASASQQVFPEQPANPKPLRLIRIRDDDPLKIKRPPRAKAG